MARSVAKHLFVYGTLREDPRHHMYRVLARSSVFVGDGFVNARLFDLGGYPGMALAGSPDERVVGELYRLKRTDAHEVLSTLDEYEGLGPGDPRPHEYRREVVDVRLNDGRTIPAWAYILTEGNPPYPRIPAEDYLKWREYRDNT
jgi:gamma-glutamylcyclotransferase (GGCT)/AIG2-like uncharacterized protein YtfP